MKEKIIKYLKTIFLWILIVGFITSLISFINKINSFIIPAKIDKKPTNESFISQANKIETELNDLKENLKDKYGENYPALGIIYYSYNWIVCNLDFFVAFRYINKLFK